jgi:charged multivesicular body protein 4
MNLFGKKKAPAQSAAAAAPRAANTTDTIKLLRDSLDTLEKRENHIAKKVEAALLEAKQKAAKKDKRGKESNWHFQALRI